jgi:fatty acid desaturase
MLHQLFLHVSNLLSEIYGKNCKQAFVVEHEYYGESPSILLFAFVVLSVILFAIFLPSVVALVLALFLKHKFQTLRLYRDRKSPTTQSKETKQLSLCGFCQSGLIHALSSNDDALNNHAAPA